MRKLFLLHVVFSYSICVAVGAYIGSTIDNNTPTSGIEIFTRFYKPNLLYSSNIFFSNTNYIYHRAKFCDSIPTTKMFELTPFMLSATEL